jgi:hypothetical protein
MDLTYQKNINGKLYQYSFLEVRLYNENYKDRMLLTILLDGKRWGTGIVKQHVKKFAMQLTESECLLAFNLSHVETIKMLGRIYKTSMPNQLMLSVFIVEQKPEDIESKFSLKQSLLF